MSDDVRIVAWLRYSKFKYVTDKKIEIKLPRNVSTKFVTAAFIESENYLEGWMLQQHPNPNVDCHAILFSGHKLDIPHTLFP